MQDDSGTGRPPRPSHWSDEITEPTELAEVVNHDIDKFFTDNSERISDIPADSSRYLTPIEEYLAMTKRLIKSKTLSPRTSKILKNLYIKYKTIGGYDPVPSYSAVSKDSMRTLNDLDRTGLGKPSTSTDFDNSSIASEDSDDEMPVIRRATIPVEDPEPYWFTQAIQKIQSYSLDRPCDQEKIKIDYIFTDFSIADEDRDRALKKRIEEWMKRENQSSTNTPSVSRQDEPRRLTKTEILKKIFRGMK